MRAMPSRRSGFTLIEIVLVVGIIAVVTTVAIVNLAGSLRGNRLRTAVRQVVTVGRYARSMALLDQRERDLVFEMGGENVDPAIVVRVAQGGSNELRRVLQGVRIAEVVVDTDGAGGGTPETPAVRYRTNGRCDPYRVRIEEAGGAARTVVVDALSEARTEDGE
jgi:prepilin-type N-terminal cleavage/methylation domain-containing protein